MTTLPHKKGPSHGGVRGDDLNIRSSQFEGLFGRIFRSLPAATWSEDALRELARETYEKEPGHVKHRMIAKPEATDTDPRLPTAPTEKWRTSRLHDDEENLGIDAGYTYLGQFIDHDLTFDPASSLQKRNDVNALVDFRTPRFDLDSVYGRGPDDQPYMYDSTGRYFQLGSQLFEGEKGKKMGHDLPRHQWEETDGKETKVFNRALIGDKRNDENVIISQLHGIFLKFHNRFAKENKHLDFPEVQRQVRWHYQYVVLHDFLYQIAKKSVIESVLPHLIADSKPRSIYDYPPKLKFYKPRNEAFLPIEFAAAVYRFGHSMVRPIYRLNTKLKGGNIPPDPTKPTEEERGVDGRQFIFAGIKGRGLNGFNKFPKEWGIDWNLFFDLSNDKQGRHGKDRTQPSYKIDTSLVNPLAFLGEFSKNDELDPLDNIKKLQPGSTNPKQPANLALRNLLRGMAMSLPSGQDIALEMGLEPIKDDDLRVGKATNLKEYNELPTLASISDDFKGKAPLWYYVLAEAQHEWKQNGGKPETHVQLGEIGSRIVVETFAGILMDDSHSILRQAPAWKPEMEIGEREKFDMAEFIKYALGKELASSY
ncbi:peroxidase family protein [Emticicia fontis]